MVWENCSCNRERWVACQYLFFPLEWNDTMKLMGGSIMAADSNFQACL